MKESVEFIQEQSILEQECLNLTKYKIIPLLEKEIEGHQDSIHYVEQLEVNLKELKIKSNYNSKEYDLLDVIIIGAVNSGKSTLANYLIDEEYFNVSNTAETYCITKLSQNDETSYRIQLLNIANEEIFKQDCKTKQEFVELIQQFRRSSNGYSSSEKIENLNEETKEMTPLLIDRMIPSFDQSEIKQINLFVKDFAAKSLQLPCGIRIHDTPATSEKLLQKKTECHLNDHFMTSLILCTVSLDAGTPNLNEIQSILKKYEETEASYRIIFILTKFKQLLDSCSTSIKTEKDKEMKKKKSLEKANDVITKYRQQINKYYPNTQIVLFESNDEIYSDYFYNQEDLIVYSASRMSLVDIGPASINLLKEKISIRFQRNPDSSIHFRISDMKLSAEKAIKAIHTFYGHKILDPRQIEKNRQQFEKNAATILKEASAEFESRYINYRDGVSNDNPNLRGDISNILEDLTNWDKQFIRFSKKEFQSYLVSKCRKSLPSILLTRIRKIKEKVISEATTKISDLHKSLSQKLTAVPSSDFQNVMIANQQIDEVLDLKCEFPGQNVNEKTVSMASRFLKAVPFILVTGMIIYGVSALIGPQMVFYLAFTETRIKVLSCIGSAVLLARVWSMLWRKKNVCNQILEDMVKEVKSNSCLDTKVSSYIDQVIKKLEANLTQLSRDTFVQPQPSDDIPACEIYKDFSDSIKLLKTKVDSAKSLNSWN